MTYTFPRHIWYCWLGPTIGCHLVKKSFILTLPKNILLRYEGIFRPSTLPRWSWCRWWEAEIGCRWPLPVWRTQDWWTSSAGPRETESSGWSCSSCFDWKTVKRINFKFGLFFRDAKLEPDNFWIWYTWMKQVVWFRLPSCFD